METGDVMPAENDTNSKITDFFELCVQSKNRKDIETVVSKFWNKYEDFSDNENLCEFDIACMYAFDYVYKENSECLAAVSRSVYAYLDQNILASEKENRNRFINCGNDCFLTRLRNFENFESEEGMNILVQSQISSIMDGNLGFAHFLAKFGLVDFTPEVNEKSRKMIKELVNWFNLSYPYSVGNSQAEGVKLDELLNRMTQSEISFRRSMLIFCTVCIVNEYGMYEKLCRNATRHLDLDLFASRMKSMCKHRMRCLDLYIDATTETKITFKDIEIFTTTILNPPLDKQFCRTLLEKSEKLMSGAHRSYNPRSLKDLTRCKVRECVPISMMLTEQVKHFSIPETLKEFILFHSGEIWDLLIKNQSYLHSIQLMNNRISEFRNERAN